MNEFKIGDEAWMLYTNYGRSSWANTTIIYPVETEIMQGTIVDINMKHDSVYIYISGETELVVIGYTYFEEWAFKSKSEAIDAMIARLEAMREEE